MYKCPKCGGSDFYQGKKQVDYGFGLTRYSMQTMRDFCRKCDIEPVYIRQRRKGSWPWFFAYIGFLAVCGVAVWLWMLWVSAGSPRLF